MDSTNLHSDCITSDEFPPTTIFALLYFGIVKSHPDLQQHLTYMHRANVSLCLKVSAGACVRSLCISSVHSLLFISAIKRIKLHKIYIWTIILILTWNGIYVEMVIHFNFIGKQKLLWKVYFGTGFSLF